MKKVTFATAVKFLALVAIVTSVSSCNRGYGCPSNFSIDFSIVDVINTLVTFFVG